MKMSASEGQTPDKWVVLKFVQGDVVKHVILSSWFGGYLHGDEWRLSSHIDSVEKTDRGILARTISGSSYNLRKGAEGMSSLSAGIYTNLKEKEDDEIKVVLLDEMSTVAKEFGLV